MIRKYISIAMSVQILQNLTESLNYFGETLCIRTFIPFNFTYIIDTETRIWQNQLETKVGLL